MKNEHIDAKLKSILVFGAKDHIGSLVVRYIHEVSPEVKLRVATHDAKNLASLQNMFPYADAVVANLLEVESLSKAVKDMEGIFQISPDVFNEDLLVDNMIAACKSSGTVKHIIRILGITPPGISLSDVPNHLKEYRYYPGMQHQVAKDRYQESGLPVTFVNVAGYYMDDFSRMFAQSILEERTIRVAFDKMLAWIHPADVAEVSARLLLIQPKEYTGQIIDLTGKDLFRISAVADLFSRVLKTPVFYDGDEGRFYRAIKPVFTMLWGSDAPEYFMRYFKWETEHDAMFKLTPHAERILGKTPRTFEQWVSENRAFFLDAWAISDKTRNQDAKMTSELTT